MTTLMIKDLCQTEELDRKAMAAVKGGMMNLYDEGRPVIPPIEPHGGGTSWSEAGMRGLYPTFAVDGSPAPVRPY
jgi:hypothetical protein